MKNAWLWILLALSFASLDARGQMPTNTEKIRNFTDEFVKNKLATDPSLKIDTVWVNNLNDIDNWADFGEYNARNNILVLKYLATKTTDKNMQDRVAVANGTVPLVWTHEGGEFGHRGRTDFIYKHAHPGWSVYDYMQTLMMSEIVARLAEIYDMRQQILDGKLTQSMAVEIANDMPTAKGFMSEYFIWLSQNKIGKNVGSVEAALMLKTLEKWIAKPSSDESYFTGDSGMASFYANQNISILNKYNMPDSEIVGMDDFMNTLFTINGQNILKIAGMDATNKFIKCLAQIMVKYKNVLSDQDKNITTGWARSIENINKKYKKQIADDSGALLRAANYMDTKSNN